MTLFSSTRYHGWCVTHGQWPVTMPCACGSLSVEIALLRAEVARLAALVGGAAGGGK